MFNAIVPAILLGAAAVSAKPVAYGPLGGQPPNGYSASASSWGSATSTAPSGAGQTPFKFPLQNGFPTPNAAQLLEIEQAAHGSLPNGPPVTELNSTTVFQLIAFNEAFEVAFFTDLLFNITNRVSGYEIDSQVLFNYVVETITAVQAQEECHFLGANGILSNAGKNTIEPSEYVFPVDNFDDAISLAKTFTDLVMGTLQDGQAGLAANGDFDFIPLLGAVQGQEGEQTGYYRSLGNLIPSESPFLTRSKAPFAFSALNQNFVVPGTSQGAGNAELFDSLPIFGALNVESQNIQLQNQNLQFKVQTNSSDSDIASFAVTFINQQNVPFTAQITDIQTKGDEVTFNAFFPFADLIAEGLTIALVTKGAYSGEHQFATVDEVAAATVYGPGLIELN